MPPYADEPRTYTALRPVLQRTTSTPRRTWARSGPSSSSRTPARRIGAGARQPHTPHAVVQATPSHSHCHQSKRFTWGAQLLLLCDRCDFYQSQAACEIRWARAFCRIKQLRGCGARACLNSSSWSAPPTELSMTLGCRY